MALWAPLIAIMIWMSGNFFELQKQIADIRVEIAESEKRLSAQIQELDDRLSAQIQELDDRLSAQIQELDDRLSAQIQELDDRLSAQIQELDDRIVAIDNKLNTIGTMTVLVYRDGEITPEELAAIWESATSPD